MSFYLFFLFFGILNSSLTIIYPPDVSGTSFQATQVITNTQSDYLFGRVVLPTQNTSLAGNIVLLSENIYYNVYFKSNPNKVEREDLILGLQNGGAIGVILLNTDMLGALYNDLSAYPEINITVVESNCLWLYENLEQDFMVNITFDWNQYQNFANSNYPYIIFSVTIGIGAIVGISLSSFKLWKFVKIKRKRNVATVCLTLEIMAGILRFLYTLDPLSHYNVLPTNMAVTLSSCHFPFYYSCTLLISLYWFMLMRPTKIYLSKKALKKIRIPLFVIAGTLFVIEIIQNIIRITTGIDMTMIVSILYTLLDFAVIVFFFWNGFRIYAYLNNTRVNDKDNIRLLKATRIILLSGIISLTIFGTGGILISNYGLTPQGKYASMFILFTCVESVSVLQILSFDMPKKKDTNDTKDTITIVQ